MEALTYNLSTHTHIMKNTYRYNEPIQDLDGRTVYGLYESKPVYNPDFQWPAKFQRPDDVWVDEETDQVEWADSERIDGLWMS